jgi:hypothetical protein
VYLDWFGTTKDAETQEDLLDGLICITRRRGYYSLNHGSHSLLLVIGGYLMTNLSPAAQAVLDAWAASENGVYLEDDPERLAAALMAAADQVVPVCSTKSDRGMQRMMIRNDFLVIADELKGQS